MHQILSIRFSAVKVTSDVTFLRRNFAAYNIHGGNYNGRTEKNTKYYGESSNSAGPFTRKTLAILFSLKTMKLLHIGVATPFSSDSIVFNENEHPFTQKTRKLSSRMRTAHFVVGHH